MPSRFCEAANVRDWTLLPFLALFGHGAMSDLSPLSGVKRKTFAKRRETGKE